MTIIEFTMTDLKMSTVSDEIKQRFVAKYGVFCSYEQKLRKYQNNEVWQLLDNARRVQILQRQKPFELMQATGSLYYAVTTFKLKNSSNTDANASNRLSPVL